jgi:hypothetical protein
MFLSLLPISNDAKRTHRNVRDVAMLIEFSLVEQGKWEASGPAKRRFGTPAACHGGSGWPANWKLVDSVNVFP